MVYRDDAERDVEAERVGDVASPVVEELDADVDDTDTRWRRTVDQRRRAINVDDEQRLETLNDQLWHDDDQWRGPEDDDETDGSTDRVNVASLQRPTDGVVPAAIDREFEF